MAACLLVQVEPATMHCYQAGITSYDNFLETNFDGTANGTSVIGQIFNATKMDNETYTMSEMLKQNDKMNFVKAMETEV